MGKYGRYSGSFNPLRFTTVRLIGQAYTAKSVMTFPFDLPDRLIRGVL